MKDWSTEKLQRFEAQVVIILDAEQREKESGEAQRSAEASNAKGGYQQPVYAIEVAGDSQAYRDADKVLREEYNKHPEDAKGQLNAARHELFTRHINSKDLDAAVKIVLSLNAAGSKPHENSDIMDALKRFVTQNGIVDGINALASTGAVLEELVKADDILVALIGNAGKLAQDVKDVLLANAVVSNRIGNIEKLANAGAKISDENLRTLIGRGIGDEDKEFMDKLMRNAKEVSNETLKLAVEQGVSADMIGVLAAKVPNEVKDRLQEAFVSAVESGNIGAVKALLDNEVYPNTRMTNGETALMRAARTGNTELANALVENIKKQEYSLNEVHGTSGKTALHFAVEKGGAAMVQKLLDNGANVNATNRAGETALHVAVSKGDVEMAQSLLLSGANVHINAAELAASIKKAETSMKYLFDHYLAVEKEFKENFVPKMNEVIKGLDPKQELNDYYVMQKLDEVLKAAYGTDRSFKQSFQKGAQGNQLHKLDKKFRLGFVEEALMTIQAAFEAIFSENTYQQIKFSKMAEAIYEKVQGTAKFRELSAPSVGKQMGVQQDILASTIAPSVSKAGPEVAPVLTADDRLIKAIKEDNVAGVKAALAEGAGLTKSLGEEYKIPFRSGPLAKAIAVGAQGKVLEALMASGKFAVEREALLVAVTNGKPGVLESVIAKAPKDMNAYLDFKDAIEAAMKSGKYKETGMLIDSMPAQLKEIVLDGMGSGTTLIHAVEAGSVELVDLVLKAGENPNDKTLDGKTALMYAVEKGNAGLVQVLLLNGADVHIADKNGKTARDYGNGNKEIANLFNAYEAVEKDFKDKLVPAIKGRMQFWGHFKDGSGVQDITDEYMLQIFVDASQDAYGESKIEAFTENVDGKIQFQEQFKLGFIEEFFTATLPAFFESLGSDASYKQLKVERLAEIIYGKISDTPEFQKLAAPVIGKAAEVVINAMASKTEDKAVEVKQGLEGLPGKPILGEHTRKYIESQKGGIGGPSVG